MFGMGFTEIMLIAIIAIVALGPEKLPGAMVDIAKFFKKFKSGIEDAKSALDSELELTKLKEEADKYKSQLTQAQNTLSSNNLESLIDDATESTEPKKEEKAIEKPKKKEKVSFDNKKAKAKSEDA